MPIRVAAIEVSHWHAIYDPAYLKQLHAMPNVELVGLQDPDLAVAQHRADAVGRPPVFADWQKMLHETKPDFVLVLGRHSEMAGVGHHLLDAGYPFMMEKPMGLNATEVQALADKADACSGYAAVPFPQRRSPFAQHARTMLQQGAFGPLSHVYIRMNRFSSARYLAWNCPWMLDPRVSGGGCLRNLGTHGFDILAHLFDHDWQVTGAQMSAGAWGHAVEDYVSVLLRSSQGLLATVEIGNTYPRKTTEGGAPAIPSRDRLLDGADGEWKICGRDALLSARDGQLRVVTALDEEYLPGEPEGNPSFQLLSEALNRWQHGLPPAVGVHDCLRAVKLVDQAYRLAGLDRHTPGA
jgi:predicted dehydrogenase